MNNHQYTYNQPPMSPQMEQGMMPPPFMPPQQRMKSKWQQRFLSGNAKRPLTLRQERTLPNWMVGASVLAFFIAFSACTLVWGHAMELQYAMVSSISVILFFYGGKLCCQNWAGSSERTFAKNALFLGIAVRLIWVLYCYLFFNPDHYGTTYGHTADVTWYMPFGQDIAQWISDGIPVSFKSVIDRNGAAIDDVGYPIWLGLIYLVTFNSSDVFVPFILKCFIGAYCAVCIYHVAKRHFGEGAARIAAMFVAMNPNMIYWCGTMMKETEMVFLCCLCIDLVDKTFTSGSRLTFKSLLPGVLVGVYLFFYRAPLAIVMFLAMFSHIVVASKRVMSMGKKIIAGVLVGIVLLVGLGDRLLTQTERIRDSVENNDAQQRQNFEWRSRRAGGNLFATYASRAVFAPLIFTIPFPTFNEAHKEQVVQQQMSGGSYVKNILSFFVLYVMIMMLLSGEWRRHVFILAYTLGYLVTLVLSNYAQSGRFHMPIWPMLMLFAAYGVQLSKTNPRLKRWFPLVLVLEVVACIAWNWFKLKGRGMI